MAELFNPVVPPLILAGYAVMSSDSPYVRRLRLSEGLRRSGQSASSACAFCRRKSLRCVGMPKKSLKCAECSRRGRPCVDVAWKVDFDEVDRVRKEYREIQRQSVAAQKRSADAQRVASESQAQAAGVAARAALLWERLEKLNQQADEEVECLARVIEEEDRQVAAEGADSLGSASSFQPSGLVSVSAVVPSNAEALALFEAGAFDESVFSDPFDLDALLRNPVSASGTFVGG
jgi:hypothetical protein